ncbi:MAG: response regulator [Leptospiraceae bacterium]|nr:response regulator [Leptospiraceae bacterium]
MNPKYNSIKNPIIIVDDDEDMLSIYRDMFTGTGLNFETYNNPKIALEHVKKKDYSIFITDLDMPGMSGIEFMEAVKSIVESPIILVQSGMSDPKTIIQVMKIGVFDYIIKPFDISQFEIVLIKALDFYLIKNQEKIQSKYATDKLKSQIEWLNYKENVRLKDKKDSVLRNLGDMKNSFLEGASIGSIMTMVFMLRDTMVETEEGYVVDKDIFNTLLECNEVCRHQFEGVYEIINIMEKNLVTEVIGINDLISIIPEFFKDLEQHFTPKNIKITYPTIKSSRKLKIDKVMFKDILEELVINAYKYTISNTVVNIFAYIVEGFLVVAVKNDIPKGEVLIPEDYEKIILEPFIRLRANDEEMLKHEKFGLGLGLTVVDNMVKKMNGLFFIHEITDHTSLEKKKCVSAEIFLPLIDLK